MINVALLGACRGDEEVKPGNFDGAGALVYAKAQVDFGPRIPGTT